MIRWSLQWKLCKYTSGRAQDACCLSNNNRKQTNHMTLQQLDFLGGPTTSPAAENFRTSIEAGPEESVGLCKWSSPPPLRLLPALLLLLLPVLSRLLLLLRCCLSAAAVLFFPEGGCSPSSGCWELWCCCSPRDNDRCFFKSDKVCDAVWCWFCDEMLLLSCCCCGVELEFRIAPCDEAFGEKELLPPLTFSDDVGDTKYA